MSRRVVRFYPVETNSGILLKKSSDGRFASTRWVGEGLRPGCGVGVMDETKAVALVSRESEMAGSILIEHRRCDSIRTGKSAEATCGGRKKYF